jgi:hypothetical protein
MGNKQIRTQLNEWEEFFPAETRGLGVLCSTAMSRRTANKEKVTLYESRQGVKVVLPYVTQEPPHFFCTCPMKQGGVSWHKGALPILVLIGPMPLMFAKCC